MVGKRRGPSRKKAGRAAKKPAVPLVVPEGSRLFVLDVPFDMRGVAAASGARWDAGRRKTVFIGSVLPVGLEPFRAVDYSWDRFLEEGETGVVVPPVLNPRKMRLRPHQKAASDAVLVAFKRGYRGFLEADDVGLGKTLSAISGAMRVAAVKGNRNILVVCPKGAIGHWRRSLMAFAGTEQFRFVVINYDQGAKLLDVPASAAGAARVRTRNNRIAASGNPLVDWGVVVFDESHKLKNVRTAQRAKVAARVAQYGVVKEKAPFVVWMSATAGQNPEELGYLSPLLCQMTGAAAGELKDFGKWLQGKGFCVTYNERFDTWKWGVVPEDAAPSEVAQIEAHRERDLARIRRLLFSERSPSIRRLPTDIAGWPEIQRVALPVDLGVKERVLYEMAWSQFRSAVKLARGGKDSKNVMVARLRFRQKASLLRVEGTVEKALELVESGHQVAVSAYFMESVDQIREGLRAGGVDSVEWTARSEGSREADRFRFQRGEVPVIVFSVTEAVSFHQGEDLGDGSYASDVPRSTIVHDPRYSGIDTIQIEGRCHRDGQNAIVYYAYAAGTVEESIVKTLVGRIISTKSMAGDEVATLRVLDSILDGSPAP